MQTLIIISQIIKLETNFKYVVLYYILNMMYSLLCLFLHAHPVTWMSEVLSTLTKNRQGGGGGVFGGKSERDFVRIPLNFDMKYYGYVSIPKYKIIEVAVSYVYREMNKSSVHVSLYTK